MLGGNRFGKGLAGVGFIEQRLTLQIGWFDEVSINEVDETHAGTNEEVGSGSPDGSAPDNRREYFSWRKSLAKGQVPDWPIRQACQVTS